MHLRKRIIPSSTQMSLECKTKFKTFHSEIMSARTTPKRGTDGSEATCRSRRAKASSRLRKPLVCLQLTVVPGSTPSSIYSRWKCATELPIGQFTTKKIAKLNKNSKSFSSTYSAARLAALRLRTRLSGSFRAFCYRYSAKRFVYLLSSFYLATGNDGDDERRTSGVYFGTNQKEQLPSSKQLAIGKCISCCS